MDSARRVPYSGRDWSADGWIIQLPLVLSAVPLSPGYFTYQYLIYSGPDLVAFGSGSADGSFNYLHWVMSDVPSSHFRPTHPPVHDRQSARFPCAQVTEVAARHAAAGSAEVVHTVELLARRAAAAAAAADLETVARAQVWGGWWYGCCRPVARS